MACLRHGINNIVFTVLCNAVWMQVVLMAIDGHLLRLRLISLDDLNELIEEVEDIPACVEKVLADQADDKF